MCTYFEPQSPWRRALPPAAQATLLLAMLLGCGGAPPTPLAEAAAADDVARVQALLAAHPELPRSGALQLALHWAVRHGALNAARALLEAGADLDGPDGRPGLGWTPLITAVHTRQWDVARQLLAWGAAPDGRAFNGLTPLIMAAGEPENSERIALVEDLLLAGADPGATTDEGATALGNAVAAGNRGLAARLLGAAPDLRVEGTFGLRVLAALHGADGLLARVEVGAEEADDGWPPLLLALRDAPAEQALALLEQGADPRVEAPGGRTALMLACARGDLQLVQALLAAGADPRAADTDRPTALSHAVAAGDADVVRAVLDAAPGLKLQAIPEDEGALFAARLRHRDDLLALLEERGALP